MDNQTLLFILTFIGGVATGVLLAMIFNKLRAGAVNPALVKREYEDYQSKVEDHFEETSRRFQQMTEQYQDLYQHLSEGATTLCRPDSMAAELVDGSQGVVRLDSARPIDAESQAHQADEKTGEDEAAAKQQAEKDGALSAAKVLD